MLIRAFALGSLMFWLPILLMRILFGNAWQLMLIPLTVALPAFIYFALQLFSDHFNQRRLPIGLASLLGIWTLGPFWITLVNSFEPDSGFHVSGTLAFLTWGTLIFPFTTFSMAVYQGSIFALLLSTLAVAIFSFTRFKIFTRHTH